MARFLLISLVLVAALIVGTNASNCQKCKGKNEEWKSCGACDSTCRNKHVVCPKICKQPGSCGCKTGYVRNSRRICIKEKNCPKPRICGKNEVFYRCGACDQGCNYLAKCSTKCRKGSCGCKKGYVRNENKICIKKQNCPKVCGINEEYMPCGACDQGCDYAVECIQGCREGACGCKSGYLRSNGTCVLSENCPKTPTCGPNQEIKHCGACDGTCKVPNPACTFDCRPPECGCIKGYVKSSGKCILLKNCPKTPTCGPNEELKGCGACDGTCGEKDVICTADCRPPECGCKSGYVRSNGKCILYEKCPKPPTCGPNEEIKECGACDGTCKKKDVACTLQCRQPECGCKSGYVRSNGKCILYEKCPNTPTCGPNEEMKECGACDGTCKEKDVACTLQCRQPECGCKSGYVRNNGICILYEKCPKTPTCGPNEEIKHCGACDGTCKNPSPACTKECRPPECGCMKGYVKNNGKCILLKSCPKTPTCGPNEELKECGACDGTCGQKDVSCTLQCREPECGCKSGYVRNNGTCILYKSCPKNPICGQNEEFYPCGSCDQGCNYAARCTSECRKGSCGCKKGYVRNDKRICIPQKSCPKACGINEEYMPCGACDQGCDYAVDCIQGCRKGACGCKSGYVRSNGTCILSEDCPQSPSCGQYEELKPCGACDGTCKEPSVACTAECRQPECGCMKGYVRNNGKCILLKNCPKPPTCGPNQEIKHCGACDGTCKVPNPACTFDCRPPECGCIKGYVKSSGKCILLKNCPKTPTCGPNEEIKGCGACDGTCGEKDVICTADCRPPECGCKSGYVRNNGTCILYKSCPKTPICGPNEVLRPCGACDGTCKEKDVACTLQCRQPECGCKSGYVRSNGKCILYEKCPKTPTCGPNEEMKECGACDGTCKEKDVACTLQCRQPECGCKSGYVRSNGKCILYEKCPKPPTCGPNEEIKECGACDGTCKEKDVACTLQCREPECGCKSGYVRNNGKCILYNKCPKTPTCGPNEEIKVCGACDNTCEERNMMCTMDCRPPECGCMKGYVRNNSTCISPDCCPENSTCGLYEELKPCGACDGTCKKPHPICTKICRPPQCGCMKGYVRNNKMCVPMSECPIKYYK
ncbi:Similar to swm-1: Serine protease inhibitor swm-1 (Caenorhabditis elegans) [Cotesia congregata]|uniref:Similar to swm-1: Serine protease inhibitor swm-1 (Caenorhabditis elegans) n=1 Tax=Cotesia congregata TaxID=51543 RepID=A0A8J2MSB6_COTCN|nr:Similar to swm-1: Serine protease inhibitor swm-1 (Caenorhabditis elegans) [Cotesia congregata]